MIWSAILAGLLLATSPVQAQTMSGPAATSAGSAGSAGSAVDPTVIEALKSMAMHLQSLQRFGVSVDLTGERVLMDGQKLQHTASADLDVVRPNKLFARIGSGRSVREMYFDGSTVTLYSPLQKYHASADLRGNLVDLVDALRNRFGIELPLADLFVWGTDLAPPWQFESAMNAGQDIVDGDLCDHYALRQGSTDWQIWMTAGARPMPRKLVITDRSDEARPQSISRITWNLYPRFDSSAFTFNPPKGAKRIELVPLEAK